MTDRANFWNYSQDVMNEVFALRREARELDEVQENYTHESAYHGNIVAYASMMAAELGPDHPMTVRFLEFVRGQRDEIGQQLTMHKLEQ